MRCKLLVVGQGVRPTGFARVLESVLTRLPAEFEPVHFAINHRGPPLDRGYRVVPNRLVGDPLGREQLPALLAEVRPDVVWMCHDWWMWSVHRRALRAAASAPRVVFYCPLEWPFARATEAAALVEVDRLVFYNEFGRDSAAQALAELGLPLPPGAIVPHGVDQGRFRPLCGDSPDSRRRSREQARAVLWPGRDELRDAFIVLNANRNCARKRIDRTLQAFAAFARGKPDAYLYLHMGMRDAGPDLPALARELGVADRLLVTTAGDERPEVSDEHLNLIYNACDVGVNTSTGEGWGLVAFEHAAVGAAQIVPDHSACAELWREHGLLTPLERGELNKVSVAALARQLDRLYRDPAALARWSAAALARTRDPEVQWDHVATRWARLFAEAVARAREAG